MKNRIEIPAIHDKDLEVLLKELKLLSQVENEELKCSVCGDLITMKNIGGIIPEMNSVRIICDNSECIASESIKHLK